MKEEEDTATYKTLPPNKAMGSFDTKDCLSSPNSLQVRNATLKFSPNEGQRASVRNIIDQEFDREKTEAQPSKAWSLFGDSCEDQQSEIAEENILVKRPNRTSSWHDNCNHNCFKFCRRPSLELDLRLSKIPSDDEDQLTPEFGKKMKTIHKDLKSQSPLEVLSPLDEKENLSLQCSTLVHSNSKQAINSPGLSADSPLLQERPTIPQSQGNGLGFCERSAQASVSTKEPYIELPKSDLNSPSYQLSSRESALILLSVTLLLLGLGIFF